MQKKYKLLGLEQNKEIAKMGGNTAKVARDDLENKLGSDVVSSDNYLKCEYIEEMDLIEYE